MIMTILICLGKMPRTNHLHGRLMSLVDWLGRGSVTVILMLHEGISRDMEKEEEAGEEAALHMIGGGGRVHGRERTGGIDLGGTHFNLPFSMFLASISSVDLISIVVMDDLKIVNA